MGKVTGFLEFEREDRDYLPVEERIRNYKEFVLPLPEKDIRDQAARCMNCGVPYCHGTNTITNMPTGCPVNNQIPDWNDLVYSGNWEEAARDLHSTNNSGGHRPGLPGAVRASALNIEDNGHHQNDRAGDRHRPRHRQWLGQAGALRGQTGKRSRDRSGPRRHGLRQQLARRPRRASLREARRPAG
jgi:glutamate synthase (NADPH/NADH) small chain